MRPSKIPSLAAAALVAVSASANIETSIDTGLAFATEQLEELPTLLGNNTRFMDYSTTAGTWRTQSRSSWCSGFAPGMFWYMYELTGESKWQTWAENWTDGVRQRATEADNDTGFQIYCSFGNGYQFTDDNDTDYWSVLETAAETFATQRFNPTIGAYRAWTNLQPRKQSLYHRQHDEPQLHGIRSEYRHDDEHGAPVVRRQKRRR